tara:strand:+ start:508 stop:852 length:345 start_codon:yes stop_codon:yes gene_type:complete
MREYSARRLLGAINNSMGGFLSGSGATGGGGGSSLTITNNVAGYVLKATGDANRIEGISTLTHDATTGAISASADLYVTGSNNYLYLHGTNENGTPVRFKVAVSGSLLEIAEDA